MLMTNPRLDECNQRLMMIMMMNVFMAFMALMMMIGAL